jgi:hypothetical protein
MVGVVPACAWRAMETTRKDPGEARLRRTALRSLGIASAAAFAGGVAVVGVQYIVGEISAGYPPIVQALFCAAEGGEMTGAVTLASTEGTMLPIAEVPAGGTLVCRIDAPGADYAAWNIVGPVIGNRSGPIDPALPCQSPQDFAMQDPASLRLSNCQTMKAERPGLYLLSVAVMLRGLHAADRARMLIRVVPAPQPAAEPASAGRRAVPLALALRLPAMEAEETRTADLSATFGEHGLTPQSRSFQRTVYRLAEGESFVSASFRARSAANASAVQVAYVPQSRSVTASFTLRSGTIFDRWRGWITGTVAVVVRLQQPARDIDLPTAELAIPGRTEVPLPEGLDVTGARLLLRGPHAAAPAEVNLAAATRIDGAKVTATIRDRTLVLEAVAD